MVAAQHRHLLRAGLASAHVALLLAAYAVCAGRTGDLAALNFFRIVLFSEAGLLAVWAALSGMAWQPRAAITVVGWLFCWVLLASRHPQRSVYWLGVYLLLPSFASLLLALAMQSSQRRRALEQGGHSGAHWQFTTSDLLIFTAVVGGSIVLGQWFLASRLSGESMFLFSEGSQLSILLALGVSAMPDPAVARGSVAALRFTRLAFAALAAVGLGIMMQSFWSHHFFWDALGNLRGTPANVLWEDVFSIPTFVLWESLFAVVTVCFWRGDGARTVPAGGDVEIAER